VALPRLAALASRAARAADLPDITPTLQSDRWGRSVCAQTDRWRLCRFVQSFLNNEMRASQRRALTKTGLATGSLLRRGVAAAPL